MTQAPKAESRGSLTATVEFKKDSDIFLVDSTNYKKYKAGESFHFTGGHYKKSPVSISVDRPGEFYLVVAGDDSYTYEFS